MKKIIKKGKRFDLEVNFKLQDQVASNYFHRMANKLHDSNVAIIEQYHDAVLEGNVTPELEQAMDEITHKMMQQHMKAASR